MATKKKSAKKSGRASKGKSAKKKSGKIVARKVAARKPAKKKSSKAAGTAVKASGRKNKPKKKAVVKAASTPPSRKKAPGRASLPYSVEATEPRSGRLSGDLQGLSNRAGADSESVDELLEEGNAFEAGVVSGVEDSGDDIEEVRTREVPEDDVPTEYLDQD